MISLKETAFMDKVRLTVLSDSLDIQEFRAYKVDTSVPLMAYIAEVKDVLDSKSYDNTNGSYKEEAKQAVLDVIAKAEAAKEEGLNSAGVDEWINKIKAAMNLSLIHIQMCIRDRWKSRMRDHYRYIDIKLDGTYDLSQIKIFTNVDDSYSNYYVYASVDGTNFDKNLNL